MCTDNNRTPSNFVERRPILIDSSEGSEDNAEKRGKRGCTAFHVKG
jgi:hypothetical protein